MNVPQCRTCGAKNVKPLGQLPDSQLFAGRHIESPLAGGDLWRCSKCGFVFRDPLLADDTYENLYRAGDLGVWDSDVPREDFRLIRHLLGAFDGHKLKVLDFGCYTGQLLVSLCKSFELFGIEPNERAARAAADRGVNIVAGTPAGSASPDAYYDIILACDVIEHVPNPLALLRQLRTQLKPCGLLLVSTGNCDAWLWRLTRAKFWYCQFPEHISFIGESWIQAMLRPAGLELRSFTRFNYRGGDISALRILAAILFWLSPSTYRTLRSALSKPGSGSITPGSGATKDHMLCVFRPM